MDSQDSPRKGLTGATLGFFTGFAAVALFGPTAHRLKEVMALSPLMVGLLIAAPALSGSLLRIPFGAWVESTGGKKPFLILLGASFTGMVGLTCVMHFMYPSQLSAAHYPLVLFLGVLAGCGIATFSVGIGQTSYWYPQHRQGVALATYAGVGNLAPGLFSVILPFVVGAWGLDVAYCGWLAFLGLGILVYLNLGSNAPYFQLLQQGKSDADAREEAQARGQELFPSGNAKQSLAKAARLWQTWALNAIYFTTFGGFIALTGWFPTYWRELHELRGVDAGALTAAFALASSAIRVPGGIWSDRLGGERVAVASLIVCTLASLLLTFSSTVLFSVGGSLVLGCAMGVANAAVFKLVPLYIGQAVGGAAGWIGGLGAFGGFAIPPTMSLVVESNGRAGYALGFWAFVGMGIVSVGMALSLMFTSRAPR